MGYEFVAGDTGSTLQVTCKDNATGAVINLTGKTATLRWKNAGGALQSAAMTIASPATGIATYTFTSADLTAGLTQMEVRITDTATSNYVTQIDLFTAPVRAALT